MDPIPLDALARELLEGARLAPSRRSARTVYGGHQHALRQTMIALIAGRLLAEHRSPGEATLQVLRGRVRMHSDGCTWDGRAGDLLDVPQAAHDVEAVDDAVVLLTVTALDHQRAGAAGTRLRPDGVVTRGQP
jgi:quercetin dioxygenase-like cupin family protein